VTTTRWPEVAEVPKGGSAFGKCRNWRPAARKEMRLKVAISSGGLMTLSGGQAVGVSTV